MKTLQEMKDEQKQKVAEYRRFIHQIVKERLEPRKSVSAHLNSPFSAHIIPPLVS